MDTFETFAIVELFGHTRIAGKICEQTIAGKGFLQVDVPTMPPQYPYPSIPGFTRFYGPDAVYSITPVSEEIAMQAAVSMRTAQINFYLLPVPQLETTVGGGDDYESPDEEAGPFYDDNPDPDESDYDDDAIDDEEDSDDFDDEGF